MLPFHEISQYYDGPHKQTASASEKDVKIYQNIDDVADISCKTKVQLPD